MNIFRLRAKKLDHRVGLESGKDPRSQARSPTPLVKTLWRWPDGGYRTAGEIGLLDKGEEDEDERKVRRG